MHRFEGSFFKQFKVTMPPDPHSVHHAFNAHSGYHTTRPSLYSEETLYTIIFYNYISIAKCKLYKSKQSSENHKVHAKSHLRPKCIKIILMFT